jgi:transcriptional regulator with PAS, ATPase and Fis domain
VYRPWTFTAASAGRQAILALAQRVARADCPVLILGPTGVGKEVLAEDIHHHSPRAQAPLVALNCAAIPSALFESELFGHARGAYTSAATGKQGLVELAHRGTLFLDEVGELSPEAQAKLLRFLANGKFWPVGATEERGADVRVIAATNRDLRAAQRPAFREDLFFRLSVVTLAIPPLEPADQRELARALAIELARQHRAPLGGREADAIAELAAPCAFAGGVRELRNTIERYFVLRDPGDRVERAWQVARELGAPPGPRGAQAQEPPGRASLAGGRGAGPLTDATGLLRGLEQLVFLLVAREASTVRELAQRMDRSIQAIYERLKRARVPPRQLGRSDAMERAIREACDALAPHRSAAQAILSALLES